MVAMAPWTAGQRRNHDGNGQRQRDGNTMGNENCSGMITKGDGGGGAMDSGTAA